MASQQLTKHAQHLMNLRKLVKGGNAQEGIKGTPGGDVVSEKMPDSTETTDKNGVGADKNKPQEYGQKPSTNEGEPLKGAKSAAVQALADEVISDVEKAAAAEKTANAQEGIKGTPGGDVVSEKMPDSTEKTDKNAVGADKNKPQEFGQKPSDNEGEPLKGAKKAEVNVDEMAAKVASYQMGRQFAAALLKQAVFSATSDSNLLKEAGRRDFEAMIAQASEEVNAPAVTSPEVLKQAEAAGAAYFDDILKQASVETILSENAELKTKLAQLEQRVNESHKFASDTQSVLAKEAAAKEEEAKEAARAVKIAQMVKEMLKNEPAK